MVLRGAKTPHKPLLDTAPSCFKRMVSMRSRSKGRSQENTYSQRAIFVPGNFTLTFKRVRITQGSGSW